MRQFFDTSVLVAACWRGPVHHLASVKRLAAADKKDSACGIHSLAEVYAVMTVLPVKPMIPPEQPLLFVVAKERKRFWPIASKKPRFRVSKL